MNVNPNIKMNIKVTALKKYWKSNTCTLCEYIIYQILFSVAGLNFTLEK